MKEFLSKDTEHEERVVALGPCEKFVSAAFSVGNWGPTEIKLLVYFNIDAAEKAERALAEESETDSIAIEPTIEKTISG